MAPGIVGGGTGKAETLTAQTAAMLPEAAKLMQAKMDLAADNLAKAEAGTLAVRGQRRGTDRIAARHAGLDRLQAFVAKAPGRGRAHFQRYRQAFPRQ
ncbi:hypothetical protein LP420_29690 [Massilia sp. B-10]|nr:hypothetical protein LP420_29690 [Massilia sp. B-10]